MRLKSSSVGWYGVIASNKWLVYKGNCHGYVIKFDGKHFIAIHLDTVYI